MDVDYIHVPLSAVTMITAEQLEDLYEVFDRARKPLLIHCRRGVDRTGMVTALYLLEKGYSKREALEMFSFIKYGYMEWLFPSPKRFIEIYQNRFWALNEYNPCFYPQPPRICYYKSSDFSLSR